MGQCHQIVPTILLEECLEIQMQNWLCGYSMMIGKDTIFRIEARSILEGLRIAWEKEFRQLDLECDNALLVESLLDGGATNSKMVELRLIHQILCRSWK
ncbi:hypothetical protein Godav_001236, partial [Gossypium davidsonii]|nr:hypothetical protein [Gossypium davidsonii]MBA0668290.1 hypothetical protein [Gossypium klotzschianum]